MGRQTQEVRKTAPVRVFEDQQDRIKAIVDKKHKREKKHVTDLEVTAEIFDAGLPKIERKYGVTKKKPVAV